MKLEYISNGGFFPLVPARDLTEDDLKELPEDITTQVLLDSGLYSKGQIDIVFDNDPIATAKTRKPKKDGE